ncbi:MAG: MBL fold metallo-hydrolase [Solirubrobacteraceae bacterium]
MSDAEQAHLAAAAAAGVHRIALPTPFRVGRVNVYLIEDEPLTLLDAGPNSGTALEELEEGLAEHGRRIEDLGLLLLTHQHMDHAGLASVIARRSGAEVAAIAGLARYLRDFASEAKREDDYAAQAMLRHGVPADYARALRTLSDGYRGWGAPVEVAGQLQDGAEVRLRDRTLQAIRRPGHSPSDTVFHDAQQRLLLAGDHLIATISSNALVTPPLPGEQDRAVAGAPAHLDGRPAPLLAYVESLRATQAMDVETVLPGHGSLFGDHAPLIAERLRMHERRARKIATALDAGPLSAHEIAQALWGDVALTQAYLTLSEVLGHLDLLLADGGVRESADGEIIRFEIAYARG